MNPISHDASLINKPVNLQSLNKTQGVMPNQENNQNLKIITKKKKSSYASAFENQDYNSQIPSWLNQRDDFKVL
jgi:hypothetical protein